MINKNITNYQDILMALPHPVFVTGMGGIIRLVNIAGEHLMSGLGAGAVFETKLLNHIKHPAFVSMYEDIRNGDVPSGQVEFSLNNPYLSTRQYFSASVSKVEISGKALIVVVLNDMTSERQADNMRTDFIANVSHELRTPLSSILGFVETLQNGAVDDKEVANKFLSIMATESTRMKRVLDDLLSLSRIEQDEHSVPNGTVQIDTILRFIGDGLELVAQAKNVGFVYDLMPNTVINGESDQLTQVFQNLMANAIKYGNENSTVKITMSNAKLDTAEAVKVSISDFGDGIEEKYITRLTERFYRVDKARSRKEGGTGLGLAIVKHIVNHHRGILDIESTVGQGSIFSVTLPKRII